MSIEDTTGNMRKANPFQVQRVAREAEAHEKHEAMLRETMPRPSLGLGDLVERAIHAIIPASWLPKAGGCGCAARKKALNDLL